MALRINTNISALNAHKNMTRTDNNLSTSLQRLSSGLRINKAADDASGMSIADSLKSQALGLGQAIKNGNDAINIVQTADAALEESINIVNTIKTKSIQAAQDGQTLESRAAIQADIDRLMEELDNIAKTTSFNGQKLLSGNFSDKKFQIGAYSGETATISIASTQSNQMGHTTTGKLVLENDAPGKVEFAFYSSLQNANYEIEATEVKFNNQRDNSLGMVADSINRLSDVLGISARAEVRSETANTVGAGTLEKFSINGVAMNGVKVVEGDTNRALTVAINQKTAQHGVIASIQQGKLALTSQDGRAIKVEGDAEGLRRVFKGTEMSTIGHINLTQTGSNDIMVTNIDGGNAVELSNNLDILKSEEFTDASFATQGSKLAQNTLLGSGWKTDQDITGTTFTDDLVTDQVSQLASNTVVGKDSILSINGSLNGNIITKGASSATEGVGRLALGSTIAKNSILGAGSKIGPGIELQGKTIIDATGKNIATDTVKKGSVLAEGTILASDTKLANTQYKLTAAATSGRLAAGTRLAAGSTVASGTVLGFEYTSGAAVTMTDGKVATAGSILQSGSTLGSGTVLANNMEVAGNAAATASGATLAKETKFVAGSKIGSGSYVDGKITVFNTDGSVAGEYEGTIDDLIEVGASQYAVVTEGTLTLSSSANNLINSGSTMAAGSSLTTGQAFKTRGDQTLEKDQYFKGVGAEIAANSTFAVGSVLAENINASNKVLEREMTLKGADNAVAVGSSLAGGSAMFSEIHITSGAMTANGTIAANSVLDAVSFSVNQVDGTKTTTGESIITAGSSLGAGSRIGAGTVINGDAVAQGSQETNGESFIASGSTLKKGTVIGAGTELTKTITVALTPPGSQGTKGDSYVASGTVLKGETVLGQGTDLGSMKVYDQEGNEYTGVLIGPVTLGAGTELVVGSGGLILKSQSKLGAGSTLASGSAVNINLELSKDVTLQDTKGMNLAQGSKLSNESTLKKGSRIETDITLAASATMDNETILKNGSILAEGTSLVEGSRVSTEIELTAGAKLGGDMRLNAGSSYGQDSVIMEESILNTDVTLSKASVLTGNMENIKSDIILGKGSVFGDGTNIRLGSEINARVTLKNAVSFGKGQVVQENSILKKEGSLFRKGSFVGAKATLDRDISVTGEDFKMARGTRLATSSMLANGSSIGGTITLAANEKVRPGSLMQLNAGSILMEGSTIGKGTYLTNDIKAADGNVYKEGTVLENDIVTQGTNVIADNMTLKSGSIIAEGSVITANSDEPSARARLEDMEMNRLSDIKVLTQEGAQKAITIADSALKNLDKARADLGSVQNQLAATISNISTTRVNVFSAESTIRDVDFADESSNFTKMQVLQQAGTFAMSQANASAQSVMSLLQ